MARPALVLLPSLEVQRIFEVAEVTRPKDLAYSYFLEKNGRN